jgi:methyltransferase
VSLLHLVVGLVVAQRAGELWLAANNTRRLQTQGAVEIDAAGYKWLIALHGAWLASMLLLVPAETAPAWPLLGCYAALQPGRAWAILTLGRRWTTRILVLPGAPLVRRGPYRYLRHPNYAIVIAEIALLPLAFEAATISLVFSAANLVLLGRRVAIEDRALAPCREPSRARRPPGPVHPAAPDAAAAEAAAEPPAQPVAAAAVAAVAGRRPR